MKNKYMKKKKIKSCGRLYGAKKIKGELWGKKEKREKIDCYAEKEKLYGDEMMREKMHPIRKGERK